MHSSLDAKQMRLTGDSLWLKVKALYHIILLRGPSQDRGRVIAFPSAELTHNIPQTVKKKKKKLTLNLVNSLTLWESWGTMCSTFQSEILLWIQLATTGSNKVFVVADNTKSFCKVSCKMTKVCQKLPVKCLSSIYCVHLLRGQIEENQWWSMEREVGWFKPKIYSLNKFFTVTTNIFSL